MFYSQNRGIRKFTGLTPNLLASGKNAVVILGPVWPRLFILWVLVLIVIELFNFSRRFICKNNGVLFENDLLQIGVKAESKSMYCRLVLFFGNKTTMQFTNFSSSVSTPGELSTHIL